MRYDCDGPHGFHVDVYKNNPLGREHRIYTQRGTNGPSAGMGTYSTQAYREALDTMNNLYSPGNEACMVNAFLSAQI